MSNTTFLIRCGAVLVSLVLAFWLTVGLWSDEDFSEDYCLYADQYYTLGATLQTDGTVRICAAGEDGEGPAAWVDP